MSRAAISLQTTRNHIDLRVSPRRLLRVGEQCGIGMAPRESGCKAQAQARQWVRDRSTVTSVRRERGLTRTPFILSLLLETCLFTATVLSISMFVSSVFLSHTMFFIVFLASGISQRLSKVVLKFLDYAVTTSAFCRSASGEFGVGRINHLDM